MTIKEIKRAVNRITGATMFLCEFPDGTPCLMINGINQKTGKKAVELFITLQSKC